MFAPFTIPQVLYAARDRDADAVAIEDGTGSTALTYRQVIECAEQRSRTLAVRVPVGQRIAVMMEAGIDLSLWILAVMWRHTVVPLRPESSDDEIERYLTLTRTEVVLASHPSDRLRRICRDLDLDVVPAEHLDGPQSLESSDSTSTPTSDSIAVVLLTSGSAGAPKVVPLTHRNLLTSTRDMARSLELTSTDRTLVLWSPYHIGGLIDSLLVPLSTGGIIINGGRFTAEAMVTLIESARPTWTQFVPTTLDETIRFSERHARPLAPNSLRFIRTVAASTPEDLWGRAELLFGCPLVTAYGMTEASPLVTATPLGANERVRGSTGRSVGPEIRIVDEQDRPLACHVRGSIQIRGENVFGGYEGDDALNVATFVDGWFRTGDLGYLDANGELFVDGRAKNMINRGGDKINPSEVEEVLKRHPGVVDAAVFGIPHRRLGQMVGAAVSTNGPLVREDLVTFASEALSPHKVPAQIMMLPDLPRIGVGKIDHARLREMWLADTVGCEADFGSRTERILADIWSGELGEPVSSATVPFTAAGGDSLSAIRVVAEVERAFEVTDGTDRLLASRTIRDMAGTIDSLVRAGLAVPVSAVRHRSVPHRWNNRLNVPDFAARIASAPPGLGRKVEEQLALTHLCAHEIDALLDLLRDENDLVVDEHSYLVKQGPPQSAANLDGTGGVDETWSRHVGHDDVSLYRRHASSTGATTLVAFAGQAYRMMMPIHRLLSHLPSSVGTVLLVADPEQTFFESGVPGIASDISGLATGLRSAFPMELSGHVRTLGTSAGGLAAAVVGLELGALSASLVGADSSRGHEGIRRALMERRRSSRVDCRAISGVKRRDVKGLIDIRRTIPGSRIRLVPVRQHNVLDEAWKQGRLVQLMRWLIEGA